MLTLHYTSNPDIMTKSLLLTIPVLLIGGLVSYAEEPPIIIPIKKGDPTKNHRPHDEESSVTGFYRDGVLSLSFDSYEGMATATLTNLFTGERDSWTFSTATQPSLHTIGSIPATYTLTIKTAENTYEAIFAID